jgi:cytochrome P450
MRSYLLPFINDRSRYSTTGNHKTILDLAIKAYANEVKSSDSSEIDPNFAEMVIEQLKMFIFAGHDTSASALCFAYHMLWTNPETLAKMREEHDAVLGPDRFEATKKIKESPQLLNQLPYTLACIKETLRLYPPVGTVREGRAGFYLVQPDTGFKYPTDGFMLFGCSTAEHRMPEYWPRPDDFVPERWLAREGEPLHVRKNAFRPFELGPRNCIGQELAVLELKTILALTIRDLDVESVYPEDGEKMLGQAAFQVMAPGDVTGHPSQGMPVKVSIRK